MEISKIEHAVKAILIPFLSSAILILLVACETEIKPKSVTPDSDNGGLFLPDGFGALVVADSVGRSRHMAVNDNGDIYVKLRVVQGDRGNIALRDTDNDGKIDEFKRFGDYPNDGSFATEMRIHNGYLYYSSELVVYRQKLTPGKLIPDNIPQVILKDHHPMRWHNAKSLAFDHEGGMYVTFSAPTNACEDWSTVQEGTTANVKGKNPCPELNSLGGIWRFDANKTVQSQSDGERFATGIRSVVALAWNPSDSSLYGINHGRDYLHGHAPQHFSPWQNSTLPAEEFMKIEADQNYGWPYAYYDHFQKKRLLAPEYGGDGKQEAADFADPLMGLPAHWAPNDLLFYQGNQFPARYRQGAFVAFHGSTNRSPYPQAGYTVAFIPFQNGRPTGKMEIFADGFAGVKTIVEMADAHYRPMGLAEGPDGSLYVSESTKGKIWRIMYLNDPAQFQETQLIEMEKRTSERHLRIPDEIQDKLN